MKKILAIDPGNIESAYCLFEDNMPIKFGKLENLEFKKILAKYVSSGYEIVIENVACFGMPVGKTTFETCRWIGRFEEVAEIWRGKITLIDRPDIKLYLCGKRGAKDSNVIQTMKDRFGDKGTKKKPGTLYGISGDQWQALACGVTYLETTNG